MNLVFLDYFFTFGGAQRSTATLLNWLRRQSGVRCLFVSPSPPNTRFAESLEVEIVNLFSESTRLFQQSKRNPLKFLTKLPILASRLAATLKSRGFQDAIIVTSSRKGLITLATFKIIFRPRVKLVFYARGEAAKGQLSKLDKIILQHLVWKVFCVSNETGRNLQNNGIQEDKIHVVYTSVEVGELIDGKSISPVANPDMINVVFVGSLIPTKGPHHLIGALRYVRNPDRYVVHIVGDTPNQSHEIYARSLREQAAALGNDANIEWHGWVDEPRGMILSADVICLPSYSEGFPRIVVEGMAAGRVVLSSAVGGVPELIVHGQTGYIIPLDDAGIAKVLDGLSPGAESAAIGSAARELIRERFALDRQGSLVLDALAI